MFQCGNLYDRDLSEPAIGDIRTNAQAASPTVKGSHPSFGPTKKKLRCYPQQLESFCVCAIKSAYAIKN